MDALQDPNAVKFDASLLKVPKSLGGFTGEAATRR